VAASVVSVKRVIKAPPSAIFAIISDVSRHPEIDGSGSDVRDVDEAGLALLDVEPGD